MSKVVDLSEYRNLHREQPIPRQAVDTKNKKGKKRKLKRRAIWGLLMLVAVMAFLHSPLFVIDTVLVEGNCGLSAEKIIELSGVEIGKDNLFGFNHKKFVKNVENHPLIDEVSLSRKLPHTLVIGIKERQAAGFLVTSDGYVQFDANGNVLAIVNSAGNYSLPFVTGLEIGDIPLPGNQISDKQFAEILQIIEYCDDTLLKNIAEFNIQPGRNGIVAYTYQGIEIKIGNVEDIAERMQELNDILQQIEAENIVSSSIEYIDIRYKDAPNVKFK